MFERLKHSVLPQAAALLPVDLLHRMGSGGVLLPYYHLVTDAPAPHVENLYRFRNVREFTTDLDFFLRHFQPICLSDLLDSLDGKATLPARPFLLTFDDGFREMHDIVAPILVAKGVPAVFFLNSAMHDNRELCVHQKISLIVDAGRRLGDRFPTAWVREQLRSIGIDRMDIAAGIRAIPWAERELADRIGEKCGLDFADFLLKARPYLDTAQTKSLLAQGFAIGGHSIDHPLYSELSLEEQLRQTRESIEFLDQRFGLARKAFAFPHMDRGVSRAFFQTVLGDGMLEVTFGTGGPAQDTFPRSLQRFTMEKTSLLARGTIARQAIRGSKLWLTGQRTIRRLPLPSQLDGNSRKTQPLRATVKGNTTPGTFDAPY